MIVVPDSRNSWLFYAPEYAQLWVSLQGPYLSCQDGAQQTELELDRICCLNYVAGTERLAEYQYP